MITLTLVALFASVIFNTAKLATDIEKQRSGHGLHS